MNLYTYCRNNPVYYVDPSGHVVCPSGVERILGEIESRNASQDDVKKLSGHLREKIATGQALTETERRAARLLGLQSQRENNQRSIWQQFTGEAPNGVVHHGFPEQFKDWFARRGIDVNNAAFYYDLPEGIHSRRDENGIHTNNYPLGRNWNKEWQHYINTHSNAAKIEVFKQLLYMERKTGISEYRARK